MLKILAKWPITLEKEHHSSSSSTRDKMRVEQMELGFEPEARPLTAGHPLPGYSMS